MNVMQILLLQFTRYRQQLKLSNQTEYIETFEFKSAIEILPTYMFFFSELTTWNAQHDDTMMRQYIYIHMVRIYMKRDIYYKQ